MDKREWLVLLLLILITAAIGIFDWTGGTTAFEVPHWPIAVEEDILELRFHPDKTSVSRFPIGPGKLQTGPFNVTSPIVCTRTPAGAFRCTSKTRSSVCNDHKCEETEVVTTYFPSIKCETYQHRGRPYVLLDSCFLEERKSNKDSIVDYIYSIYYNGVFG